MGGENSGRTRIVVSRTCDVPMAKKRKLLPCTKDCRHCFACIEEDIEGSREHWAPRYEQVGKVKIVGVEMSGKG